MVVVCPFPPSRPVGGGLDAPLLPTGPPTRLKAIGKIIVKLVSDLLWAITARFSVHLQFYTQIQNTICPYI